MRAFGICREPVARIIRTSGRRHLDQPSPRLSRHLASSPALSPDPASGPGTDCSRRHGFIARCGDVRPEERLDELLHEASTASGSSNPTFSHVARSSAYMDCCGMEESRRARTSSGSAAGRAGPVLWNARVGTHMGFAAVRFTYLCDDPDRGREQSRQRVRGRRSFLPEILAVAAEWL